MGPLIIEPIKAINVLEKDSLELTVVFENADDNQVMWYRNNQPLEPNEECVIHTENGVSTIHVQNVDKKKVGKYEVVIDNKNVVAKSASSIKLLKSLEEDEILPPVFTKPIRPKTVVLGDIVLLEAEVISNPTASFQWFIDTREVTTYAKQNKLTNIYVTSRENVSCLCIENISADFLGVITCRAENFAGSVSCSASLLEQQVKESAGQAPVIITPLESVTVMDGEPIKISCIIEGQPWPHIDWYHDGESVQRARDITVARQESGLCELCIKEAFPEMSGTYSCVATNEYGSCNCECTVYIEGSDENSTFIIACNSSVHDYLKGVYDLFPSIYFKYV